MRKTYITQEYKDYPILGTSVMADKNIFIGKPMNIPNIIKLNNSSNDWKETDSLISLYMSTPEKLKGQSDIDTFPTWEFIFKENDMLISYIKKKILLSGDWNNIDYINSGYNNIDDMVIDYIKNNILRLFKLTKIDFYTLYLPLTNNTFIDDTNNNKLTNLLKDKLILTHKAQLSGTLDISLLMPNINGIRKIQYKQTKSSRNYCLLYYIEPYWERI